MNLKQSRLGIFFLLSISATSFAEADHNKQIAEQFQPIFVIDTGCPYNLPQTVNFDDDWNVLNNEDHWEQMLQHARSKPIASAIYNEVIESSSHYFITYYTFYPHDAGDNCAFKPKDPKGGHLNDASSVMLIVKKGDDGGRIEYVIGSDHEKITVKKLIESKMDHGRPVVLISSGNHTMDIAAPDYHMPTSGPLIALGMSIPYTLHNIYDELWPKRHNTHVFGTFDRTIGVRYRWNGIGENRPPWAPWAREFSTNAKNVAAVRGRGLALSFIDPIQAFADLYRSDPGYSTKYVANPYLPEK